MFQCKDLLSLTTMSQAKVVAGTGGMERGIRWSYKAENINFEKWVHGQELLIISGPVTQRKNFDLYRTIEKAIELKMSCALLLVGENYVTQIDEKVIDLAEKIFRFLPCHGMCRFWISLRSLVMRLLI